MNQTIQDWQEVLNFWFEDTQATFVVPPAKMKLWFEKNHLVDQHIHQQFGSLIEEALAGGLTRWETTIEGTLGKILLLDQFTRNCFRNSAKSFAGDSLALNLSLSAINSGKHLHLPPIQRVFLYLPLEHSEQIEYQDQCVALFAELAKEVPKDHHQLYENYYQYAVKHQEIIARFGRFPHRNEVLGRSSTEEEVAFLKLPGSRF